MIWEILKSKGGIYGLRSTLERATLGEGKMNTGAKDITGFISIIGGIFMLIGGYLIIINITDFIDAAPFMWDGDFFFGTMFTWFPIILLLNIGVSLLLLGNLWIIPGGKFTKHRISGWILLIIGWPFMAFGCFVPVAAVYQMISDPSYEMSIGEIISDIYIPVPELVIGVLLMISGIWFFTHKETTLSII